MRLRLGTRECVDAMYDIWREMMKPPPKKRGPKRWRKPRDSDAPVCVPEPIDSLRRRMWGGDGTPMTITVNGKECVPVDSLAKRVTR
jgi:hypothetical protein